LWTGCCPRIPEKPRFKKRVMSFDADSGKCVEFRWRQITRGSVGPKRGGRRTPGNCLCTVRFSRPAIGRRHHKNRRGHLDEAGRGCAGRPGRTKGMLIAGESMTNSAVYAGLGRGRGTKEFSSRPRFLIDRPEVGPTATPHEQGFHIRNTGCVPCGRVSRRGD